MAKNNPDNGLFEEFPPVSTEKWEEQIRKDLKGADYNKKLVWKPLEGFEVKPYYRKEDIQDMKHIGTPPGEFPYARGNNLNKNEWLIRQDIQVNNISEANKKAIAAITKGCNSIGFIINDNVRLNPQKLADLLSGINIKSAGINFISGSNYMELLTFLKDLVISQGIDSNDIKGSVSYDPFGYLTITGMYPVSEQAAISDAGKLIEFAQNSLENFKIITVNGQYFHNSGSSIVQELAFSLAAGNEYIAGLTDLQLQVEDIVRFIQFNFATGSDYFLEIAKLRAARLLWSKIVEAYDPPDLSAAKMNINSVTSSWNQTICDPYVNILRAATGSMSAIIGGTGSLTVIPFDTAYKIPDEFSERVARNTQLLLKEESFLDKVADPSAGSYYIENLTDLIAGEAWKEFLEIENRGGYVAAFKEGYIQEKIKNTSGDRDMNIALRKEILLGTNQYPNLHEKISGFVCSDSSKIKTQNDTKLIARPLKPYRGAEAFEDMRLKTERSKNKTPSVFLFTYGNLAMRKTRAMFSTNFFGCAGFEIIDNNGFSTIEEGIDKCGRIKPEIVVICSSDEEYPDIAPEIYEKLKNDTIIVIAGYPKGSVEMLKKTGINYFIHLRSNIPDTLREFQKQLGIL